MDLSDWLSVMLRYITQVPHTSSWDPKAKQELGILTVIYQQARNIVEEVNVGTPSTEKSQNPNNIWPYI